MTATQQSRLLGSLFSHVDEEQRLTVLHIGPALPETVEFFSRYRSKLYFLDLFEELPFKELEGGPDLGQQFAELLQFPDATSFDICLFWDLFNYLGHDALAAFSRALRPYLHQDSLGHGFGVHNLRTPPGGQLYAISDRDTLAVRSRGEPPPGYAPIAQGQLKDLLSCFRVERSMLLSDSRLELLLHASR